MAGARGRRRRTPRRHHGRARRLGLGRRRRARALAIAAGVLGERRSARVPPALRRRRSPGPGNGAGSRSTASSTRPTCGSTAPTSAIPRATSSRTASTSPRSARLADEHLLAVELTCTPERGTTGRHNITGLFQHSEAVDRDWNPGRPVAHRPRPRHRCGAHPPAPRAVPRCRRVPRPPAPAHPPRRDQRRCGAAAHLVRRRGGRRDRARPRRGQQRDRLGARPRPAPAVVAASARRPATDRDPRRRGDRRRGERHGDAPHRAARGGLVGLGAARSTASGSSSRAPTSCRRAPASPTPRPPTSAAMSSSPSKRASTACASRRTSPSDELYDAADELGVLLLQDFPLQWGYSRSIRAPRRRPGPRGRRRRRSPSLDRAVVRPRRAGRRRPATRGRLASPPGRAVRAPAAPELEQVGARPLGQARRSRRPTRRGRPSPTAACCRTSPSSTAPTATCGSAGTAARCTSSPIGRRAVPRLVRFVSEFGAQSVPLSATRYVDTTRWPELDWDDLATHHGLDVDVMLARVPPQDHPSFSAWRTATQRYQSDAAPSPHRDAAPAQVPADGRLLLLVAGRPGADDLGVGARRRAPAQGRLACGHRGLPTGDRRERPAASGAPRPATRCGSTCTWSTTCASRWRRWCRPRRRGAAATASGASAARSPATRASWSAPSSSPRRNAPASCCSASPSPGGPTPATAISATRRAGARVV